MPETQDYLKKWYDVYLAHADQHNALAFDEWVSLREKCKRDLWFLAKEIFGLDLVEATHLPVCLHFVQKDPDKPLHQQDTIKRRLLLYPRYSYKSTLNIVDCVQWIIAFPQVRIIILTSAEELGEAFIEECRDYFTVYDDADRTKFQQLFPDHCVEAGDERKDLFTTPARTKFRKEPSVCARSILGTLPGWHCDVLKPDDAIVDKNSETEPLRTKVKRKMSSARKLLVSYGFMDVVGTRWHPDDYYGYMIQKAEELGIKILCKPARWLKEGRKGIDKALLGPDDYELLFEMNSAGEPQLTYEFLAQEEKDDPRSFAYQYLNDVTEAETFSFEVGLLRERTQSIATMPDKGGFIAATVDWATTANRQSDYSVIAIARINAPNLYVLDIQFGRWNFTELCYQIIKVARDWIPQAIHIEQSPGYEGLRLELQRQALFYRVNTSMVAFPKIDHAEGAKINRIKALQPLFKAGRLFLANSIQSLDMVYDQFCKFTGEKGKKRKDDIPDAIAMLLNFLPMYERPRELSKQEKEEREAKKQQAFFNALYPDDAYLETLNEQVEPEPVNPGGYHNDIFGDSGLT